MLHTYVFNVGLGQCIYFYPETSPEYCLMVDCGHTENFTPVKWLMSNNLFPMVNNKRQLGNLTLTNYDHDHYSHLPLVKENVHIKTVRFASNITSEKLIQIKDETDALKHVIDIKDRYTSNVTDWTPPYKKYVYHLEVADFDGKDPGTNNLSQIVFIEYDNTVICIPGDLETLGWQKMLLKPYIIQHLKKTKIFIASHHGRENGYHAGVFDYCTPECIIISDKEIMHSTQESMASIYGKHVKGEGIVLHGNEEKRKVVTTRSDGHIYIRLGNNTIHYQNF